MADSGRTSAPGAAAPHLHALRGARLGWVSETGDGAKLNSAQVKLLTGGGSISSRPLYGMPTVFKPSYLLFLLTNHKPQAPDDDALSRRLRLIPFERQFVEKPTRPTERKIDIHLDEKLSAESSDILTWLVCGFMKWQDDGGLECPVAVTLATASTERRRLVPGLSRGEMRARR